MLRIQESLVWIKDVNGRQYACYLDDITSRTGMLETFAEEDFSRCLDIDKLTSAAPDTSN